MIKDYFKNRSSHKKARLGFQSGSGVFILALILIFLNLLSQKFFLRFDWTENNRYSLSKTSVRLAKSLEDPILIRAYVSEGLPQPYATHSRYVTDLLQEYKTASHGKVNIEFINPETSEKVKTEALKAGITPARFTQVASDQFQVREGYLGLVMFFQDKKETIPFIKDTLNLEYDISSRMKQMVTKEKKKLVFIAGHGETSPEKIKEGLASRLFDEFKITHLSLSTDTVITPEAVFIIGPQNKISDNELKVLDQYLINGIPVALFMNRKTVNLRSFSTFGQPTGLEKFIEHYGLRMEEDFVLDNQCQRVTIQSRQRGFAINNIIQYPAFPLANTLNKDHILTQSANTLSFPFVHPLKPLISDDKKTDLKITVLATSSKYSWISPGLTNFDPYSLPNPREEDPKGPFPLAALIEGSTTSFSDSSKTVKNLKLAVVGTGYFADPTMPNVEDNSLFLASLAEWLVQDPHFLSIPPKGDPLRPIRPVSNTTRALFKFLSLFLLPIMIVFSGFVYWKKRQSLRLQVDLEYKKQNSSSDVLPLS